MQKNRCNSCAHCAHNPKRAVQYMRTDATIKPGAQYICTINDLAINNITTAQRCGGDDFAPIDVEKLQLDFESIGVIAMHGGKKGNGFWLYPGKIGSNRALTNNGITSGNPFFWMLKDAQNLLTICTGE